MKNYDIQCMHIINVYTLKIKYAIKNLHKDFFKKIKHNQTSVIILLKTAYLNFALLHLPCLGMKGLSTKIEIKIKLNTLTTLVVHSCLPPLRKSLNNICIINISLRLGLKML